MREFDAVRGHAWVLLERSVHARSIGSHMAMHEHDLLNFAEYCQLLFMEDNCTG